MPDLRITTDARVIAQQYLEACRRYDAVPATDRILRATLGARRIEWAIQLAEELAEKLATADGRARLVPEIEQADPRELVDRISATTHEHTQAGVGTIEPANDDDEPAIGDHPLFVGGAP